MKNASKLLFGGAVFAAGVMGGSAAAEPEWNLSMGYQYTYFNALLEEPVQNKPDVSSLAYSGNFGGPFNPLNGMEEGRFSINVEMDFSSARSQTAATDLNYMFAEMFLEFTVDSPTNIFMEWDFGDFDGHYFGSGANGQNFVQIFNITTGQNDFLEADIQSGSGTITLMPGNSYLAASIYRGTDLSNASAFVQFSMVPAPGTVVMGLMSCGILAARRRRGESSEFA